jgi:hypothetical protein
MYPEILAIMFMLSSMLDLYMLVPVLIMIYFIQNIIMRLSIYSTVVWSGLVGTDLLNWKLNRENIFLILADTVQTQRAQICQEIT